ncbi:hypothetical protein [Actinosynnema sp. NPDC020468]|uniref:hypothetical protein n=1 Tax=Actinosynnema sp. NPDC020468 TaxID=3154488 RepID=UPI00340948B3
MTKTWHRPTLWLAGVMALLLLGTLVGLLVDDRVIQGSSVWLKPMKFALSLAVYSATLSWMLSLPHKGKRWTSLLATVIALIMSVEVALIALQGSRGAFSHFSKESDPYNHAVQFAFGFVNIVFLSAIALALVLTFQRATDRPVFRAVRTGLALTVLGISVGYLMLFANPRHTTAIDGEGRTVGLDGGHGVGGPDGGPGLPLTGWSTTGGDLRVPHFFGLHGLQVMIVLALLTARLAERNRLRVVLVGGLGYFGLLALLTWQALHAEPLTKPGATTLAAGGALAVATALGLWWALRSGTPAGPRPGAGESPTAKSPVHSSE